MVNEIWSILTAGLGLASIAALAWWAGRPNRMRETEQSSRDFFDAHGHWPDEDPSTAAPNHRPGPPPGETI